MNELLLEEPRTVAVKSCLSCAAALLERDKFCRWCGARQRAESLGFEPLRGKPGGAVNSDAPRFATMAIAGRDRAEVYRRISGPLVTAVVSGALSAPSTENQSALVKRMILALISIPIWLIIVLLSPLDAYAAVKDLARQI